MPLYLIGDIQGCDAPLGRLLERIDFSPSRDTLVVLGDLVNRGPESAAVLRRLHALGASAQCLLGNHDLHLLGVANGARSAGKRDTLGEILHLPDRDAVLDWLRHQAMALRRTIGGHDLLMVHAGVPPQWTVDDTMRHAGELERVLRSSHYADFLNEMYGNEPARWDDALEGPARLRFIVNALTRMRFCTEDGRMEFETKDGAADPPKGYMPWFDVPGRRTHEAGTVVAFGHWSTLGWKSRPDLISLDTGCVWGGCLSAARIGSTLAERELIQVKCEQSQRPG
ncbi:symmetrical bis(5'-nucleosyl)-tetraphosphatase [Variovorax dokdonensis]|uniref:bis(5'-nucleosyl)-tetraphosphatase (symmetrical) n=1 Tax=Variovorax dokdonensis TaxID=344883 RepID=A0ABT7N7B8_9BURK|nr:symmetrical bis(5'-nucleosyl)-tetraphosphatase [Variovorax dokdonensis]MDM0043821.1 symmetrical bis(5'-nucleosyl)-tetraphosphatase [Variovorax dokdonensis]